MTEQELEEKLITLLEDTELDKNKEPVAGQIIALIQLHIASLFDEDQSSPENPFYSAAKSGTNEMAYYKMAGFNECLKEVKARFRKVKE